MRTTFGNTFTLAVLALGTGCLSHALQAQETLAGVGAASAAGATLGAAAAGTVSGGRVTRGVGGGMDPTAEQNPEGQQPGGTTTTTVQTTVVTSAPPLNWGGAGGQQILNQLLASRPPASATRPVRSAPAQSRYSRRVSRMTAKQRTRLVMSKYQIPPRGWLAHYLLADRYKVTSGDWKFVSTETDRFYYTPSAPAMLRQSPHRVIGFHTWQDAMIAGYRPDPFTKPTPGAEFAYMARLTRGPQLSSYVEYAYSGQVTPASFAATYNYVRQVVNQINAHPYAKHLTGGVVERIIEATLTGNPGLIPRSVGGDVAPAPIRSLQDRSTGGVPVGPNGMPMGPNGRGPNGGNPNAPGNESQGSLDKREGEFNAFSNRAAAMANVPANAPGRPPNR